MENLTKLFKLVELTRSQPQCGYALAGIFQDDLSNLAEHHYLVTFVAWQLVSNLNKAGAKLNMQKVLELCLVHDLGELFGGDVASSYGKLNPKAKRLAKAFEEENQKYLTKYFGGQKSNFKILAEEVLSQKSDEAQIYKIADFVECIHYMVYIGKAADIDINLFTRIERAAGCIKDAIARMELAKFIKSWKNEVLKHNTEAEILSPK